MVEIWETAAHLSKVGLAGIGVGRRFPGCGIASLGVSSSAVKIGAHAPVQSQRAILFARSISMAARPVEEGEGGGGTSESTLESGFSPERQLSASGGTGRRTSLIRRSISVNFFRWFLSLQPQLRKV
jgi:hypothetical protein